MYVVDEMELANEISNYGAIHPGAPDMPRQVLRLTLYRLPLADVVELSNRFMRHENEYSAIKNTFIYDMWQGMKEAGLVSWKEYETVDVFLVYPFLFPYPYSEHQKQYRQYCRRSYEKAAELAVSAGYGYRIEALQNGAQVAHVFPV